MEQIKTTWGGYRKNSGRMKLGRVRKLTVNISDGSYDAIKNENKSKLIDTLIQEWAAKK